jgi:hypothetical protein
MRRSLEIDDDVGVVVTGEMEGKKAWRVRATLFQGWSETSNSLPSPQSTPHGSTSVHFANLNACIVPLRHTPLY